MMLNRVITLVCYESRLHVPFIFILINRFHQQELHKLFIFKNRYNFLPTHQTMQHAYADCCIVIIKVGIIMYPNYNFDRSGMLHNSIWSSIHQANSPADKNYDTKIKDNIWNHVPFQIVFVTYIRVRDWIRISQCFIFSIR